MPLAYADNNTEIGRYITVENKPTVSQTDLLLQTVRTRFSQYEQTVGDAINHVLRLSGYSLVPQNQMSNALKNTLTKPLPASDRGNFGPMSLKDALTTLAGPAFYLVQDPLNRMVDFKVKPQYASIYADNNKTQHAS